MDHLSDTFHTNNRCFRRRYGTCNVPTTFFLARRQRPSSCAVVWTLAWPSSLCTVTRLTSVSSTSPTTVRRYGSRGAPAEPGGMMVRGAAHTPYASKTRAAYPHHA